MILDRLLGEGRESPAPTWWELDAGWGQLAEEEEEDGGLLAMDLDFTVLKDTICSGEGC